MIFNSSFHPIITEVNPWPDVQDLLRSSEWDDTGRNVVIDDMISMVTSMVSVATEVARALEELNHHVGVQVQIFHNNDIFPTQHLSLWSYPTTFLFDN